MISITRPALGPEVEALVVEVLRSGHIAAGPMVEAFEALGAEMAGTTHAVAVSNGTVSLETALEASGIGPGDEIVTSPFTFAATINAALRTGATVRFADIGPDFTLDPDALASLITSRSRAVIPVHLYGLMADMDRIGALAEPHGLVVVEDAAQAHGAAIRGRRAGSFGIGSFSFYATKNVTAGEGGLLTTSDAQLARRFRLIRQQGMIERYCYEVVGRNLRMTDVQAAIAIPQLRRLEEINGARRRNAERLIDLLSRSTDLVVPQSPPDRTHVWHQFTVLLPDGADRVVVQKSMQGQGVETAVYYPRLVWDYPVYREHPGVKHDDTPVARDAAKRCLSLPVHPGVSDPELEQVAAALLHALEAVV